MDVNGHVAAAGLEVTFSYLISAPMNNEIEKVMRNDLNCVFQRLPPFVHNPIRQNIFWSILNRVLLICLPLQGVWEDK